MIIIEHLLKRIESPELVKKFLELESISKNMDPIDSMRFNGLLNFYTGMKTGLGLLTKAQRLENFSNEESIILKDFEKIDELYNDYIVNKKIINRE